MWEDRLGLGYSAAECAFFHKRPFRSFECFKGLKRLGRSGTLICTDALVYVPQEPPAVLDQEELTGLGRTADNFILDLVALVNWRGSGDVVREAIREERDGQEPSEAALLRRGAVGLLKWVGTGQIQGLQASRKLFEWLSGLDPRGAFAGRAGKEMPCCRSTSARMGRASWTHLGLLKPLRADGSSGLGLEFAFFIFFHLSFRSLKVVFIEFFKQTFMVRWFLAR